jgi:hypothetical protein
MITVLVSLTLGVYFAEDIKTGVSFVKAVVKSKLSK